MMFGEIKKVVERREEEAFFVVFSFVIEMQLLTSHETVKCASLARFMAPEAIEKRSLLWQRWQRSEAFKEI